MSAENTDLTNASAEPVAPVAADGASAVSTPGSLAEHIAATQTEAEPETVTAADRAEAQEPVVPDAPRDETERLEPLPTGPIKLVNGQEVEIVPLKLRETMKLLKIVTRGAGGALESTIGELDVNDPIGFAQTFGALILFSIPEAEDEAVEFIQSMVLPAKFNELPDPEKIAQLNSLAVELVNPELDDVISIIERIVRRESEDIRSLGKRISQAFKLAGRVGDLPANK